MSSCKANHCKLPYSPKTLSFIRHFHLMCFI